MLQAQSQMLVEDIVSRVMKVNYIFEGKVTNSEPYKTTDQKHVLTSNTITITKIIKGDLECGTVELITLGGETEDLSMRYSHTLQLREGMSGIFLCNLTNKEISAVDFYPESNYEKLQSVYSDLSFIKYWTDGYNFRVTDLQYNIDSLAQVYNLTQFLTQLNIVDCNNNAIIFGGGGNTNPLTELTEAPPLQQSGLNETQFQQIVQQSIVVHNPDRATDEVTYSMSNPQITQAGATKYFEFDVNLSDNLGTKYLHWASVDILYDNSIFGQYVATNTNITYTPGTLIANPNIYSVTTINDDAANIFSITIVANTSVTGLSPVYTTPQQLLHFKIKIQNCNTSGAPAAVGFTDLTTMLNFSSYDNTSTWGFATFYDAIVASDQLNIPACKTTISSFSPNPINAGVGDTLYIHGHLFGATKGTGNLFFKAADDGGRTDIPLENYDISLWSDTLIKIVFPSKDTAIFQLPGGGVSTVSNSTPGTGKFRVITSSSTSDTTDIPLTVFYSVFNVSPANSPTYIKNPLFLTSRTDSGGYYFYIDTAIWNHPDRLGCVKKAVADWVCATSVNFRVLKDTIPWTLDAAADGICMIQFGNTPDSNVAMVTSNTFTTCPGIYKGMRYDIDIIVNPYPILNTDTFDWLYDTTALVNLPPKHTDFYAILLHELGHAIGVNHITDTAKLMHFSGGFADITAVAANQRQIYLNTELEAVLCGQWVVDTSVITTFGCGVNSMQYHFLNGSYCPLFSGIGNRNYDGNITEFNIYPNPTTADLTLNFNTTTTDEVTIFVSDITGRLISIQKLNATANKPVTQSLSLSNIDTGLYFVSLSLGTSLVTKRVIKL